MEPTFSADLRPAGRASCGDLPLARGDGGGEPSNEPSSIIFTSGIWSVYGVDLHALRNKEFLDTVCLQ